MELLGMILLGILIALVIIGLYYLWQFWQGRFVIYHSNNLGNLLLYYFAGLAKAWQRGEQFVWQWFNRTGKPMHPLLAQLPSSLPLNPEMQTKLRGIPINMAYVVTEWERPTGWLYVMQAPIREIMLESLAKLGHTIQNQDSNPIVIHFRCSDIPYNRHPSYMWQKYSWYHQILDTIKFHEEVWVYDTFSGPPEPKPKVRHIILLSCSTHLSCSRNQQACSDYTADFKAYLEELGYTVEVRCGSINEDLATMLQASTFIGAISSLSTMAAVARQGQSYIPHPPRCRKDWHAWEPHIYYTPGGRLDHAQVKDYYD